MAGLPLGHEAGRMNTPTSPSGGATSGSPEYVLTEAGLESLQAELLSLRDRRGRNRYQAVDDEKLVLDARIASLEEVLARAWVVDPTSLEAGVVQIGMRVTVRDLDSGSREGYRVVGKHEPLRSGDLS